MRHDWPQWEDAFQRLSLKKDGVPLANLLRKIMPCEGSAGLIPIHAAYELAELLDPRISFSRFGAPPKREAMRLKLEPPPDKHPGRIRRNGTIWGKVLALRHSGKSISEAAIIVGERYGLSEREVTAIWSASRKSLPMLADEHLPGRKIRRRHV